MTHIRKGVITAAGRGTRQYPASQTVQKELFPLVDVDGHAKPTVQLLVEELLASGLEEVCIVANPDNVGPMRRHFRGLPAAPGPGREWMGPLSDALADMGRRLTFVVQEAQEGYGHAVFQAREWVGGEPFLLTLGDHIYFSDTDRRCARQVVAASEAHGAPVTAVAHAGEAELHRYGVIAGVPLRGSDPPVYEIAALTEKPTVDHARAHLRTPGLPDGQYLVHFGLHAFPPAVFDCLDYLIRHDLRQKGEIQLTAAQQLLRERGRYLVCEVAGVRYDMGIPEGLIETQIALALRSPFAAAARAALNVNAAGRVQ
jgi:UTP--glucose-1-phosphate uridylyltransferase